MDLPNLWISAGDNDKLWGSAGTYKKVPYDALPSISDGLDGSFGWLTSAEPAKYGMTFEQQEDPPIDDLVKEAKSAGLVLPPELVRFLSDEELHALVPSCTACYYDLGMRLEKIPDHDGPERLLRFMNDQQACYLWYVLLEPGGRHRVVVAWPEWKDEIDGQMLEDAVVPRDISVCASSFEEFIKRFWIENAIWFASNKGIALEGALAAYAGAARAAVARGAVDKN